MNSNNKKKDIPNPKYPIQSNLMNNIESLAAAAALKTTKTTIEAFTADLQTRIPDPDLSEYGEAMLSAIFLSSHSFIRNYIKYMEVQADMITSSLILTSQGLDATKMKWETVQKTAERIIEEEDAELTEKEK